MLPAPTLADVFVALEARRTPFLGILFAEESQKEVAENIIPRVGYWNERSGRSIDILCAGYGGYDFTYPFERDAVLVTEVPYKGGTKVPWGYSTERFNTFRAELEASSTWRYSGEVDLLLMECRPSPPKIIKFALSQMARAAPRDTSVNRILEEFIQKADRGTGLEDFSDQSLLRLIGDAVMRFLPAPLYDLYRKGKSYAVYDFNLSDAKATKKGLRYATAALSERRGPTPET